MRGNPQFCPHGGMVRPDGSSSAPRDGKAAGRSRERLRTTASIAAGIWTLHFVHAFASGDLDVVLLVAAGLVVLATGVLLAVARKATLDDTLTGTGCLYLVGTSLAVSVVEQHAGLGAGIGAGVSWNAVWIVLFPLMVPCAPKHTLQKGLFAATMTPLAFLFFVAEAGRVIPDTADLLLLFVPVYLAAFLAWGFATVLARLGGELSEARSVGRYELVRRLGEGGMGEVWEARHRLLARPVALKLIKRREGDDSTQLERFRREARAMARLQSPHTVDLLDFGATEDGRLFYAMELLEGLDLQQIVELHGPMPPQRVVHILKQTLDSLVEAHGRGMVHRDIKPANLHLGRYGLLHDHLKVLDFGLVKSAQGNDVSLEPTLTADGRISGTPAYLSPESLVGTGEVDGRADVYALACVAVYLLTGQRVFEADDVLRAAVAHVTEEPVPPSARGVAVPLDLEALIMSGLEKDPVRRPDSTTLRELLGALDMERWTQLDASRWWATERPFSENHPSDAPPGIKRPDPRIKRPDPSWRSSGEVTKKIRAPGFRTR